jgi:signal transduction histidine kinase
MPVQGIFAEVIQARSARVISAERAEPGKREVLLAAGFWSAACVPLVVRSRVIGVLMVAFDATAEATRPRLDLLTAAGAHFAGAIESRGLLDDLRRRVSELTLLNDVALASAQLDPVLLLESALRRIAETFGAEVALAYLREGDRLDLVSSIGIGAEALRQYGRVPLAEGGLVAEALHRLGPVRIDDLGAADPVSREAARLERLEVAVAVPLLAKGQSAMGAIAIGRRSRAPFTDSDITLLSAVGVQVGVAVENARLFANVRRRLSDLEAVHALALRIFGNVPGDVQGLLDDGCREAARALGCRGAMVLLVSEDRTRLRSVARWGLPAEAPALIDIPLERDRLAADAIRTRAPAWSRDAVHDPRSAMHGMQSVPPLVMLAVPLTSRRETRGVLYLSDDAGRSFSDAELALANALAGELAVGLENAGLYAEARGRAEELGRLHAELARTQDQLIHKERLAALGELSAVVAHEVRNPLGVIFNSLGSLRRLLRPEGDARMLMDILGEEADRLNRIVGDLLDFARPATPQVRPEPLERVVDEAVAAALVQDAEGIELERRAVPGLPLVPIDAGQVRQAVVNVAVNAIQAMPRGGRLTITTRPDGAAAALEIADTGPGMPEEVRARIFEPFFTTKASGTGLGLAVVKRIVEGHGGEISVESRPGAGTTFVLRFPLPAAALAAGPATGAGVATARSERSHA